VPRFEPSAGEPAHDRLIAEMRAVYLADDVPSYLDYKAEELLAEGRETFRQLQLERRSLVAENRDVHIFLWMGSQATAVFSAALAMAGLKSGVQDLGVSVSKIKESELVPILQTLGGMDALDPATVAEFVANIQAGKFREQVPEYLARSLWAVQNLAPIGAITALANGALV
jgi:ATP-dependent helicase Lhr and Lhr-like helicase